MGNIIRIAVTPSAVIAFTASGQTASSDGKMLSIMPDLRI
jgi:hypothetical protein